VVEGRLKGAVVLSDLVVPASLLQRSSAPCLQQTLPAECRGVVPLADRLDGERIGSPGTGNFYFGQLLILLYGLDDLLVAYSANIHRSQHEILVLFQLVVHEQESAPILLANLQHEPPVAEKAVVGVLQRMPLLHTGSKLIIFVCCYCSVRSGCTSACRTAANLPMRQQGTSECTHCPRMQKNIRNVDALSQTASGEAAVRVYPSKMQISLRSAYPDEKLCASC